MGETTTKEEEVGHKSGGKSKSTVDATDVFPFKRNSTVHAELLANRPNLIDRATFILIFSFNAGGAGIFFS